MRSALQPELAHQILQILGLTSQLGGSGGCFFCTTRGLLDYLSDLLDIGGYFVGGGGLLLSCSGYLADLHGCVHSWSVCWDPPGRIKDKYRGEEIRPGPAETVLFAYLM